MTMLAALMKFNWLHHHHHHHLMYHFVCSFTLTLFARSVLFLLRTICTTFGRSFARSAGQNNIDRQPPIATIIGGQPAANRATHRL